MRSLFAVDHLAVVDLSGHGRYLQWGIIQVSYANAIVILSMILVFVLALVVPFPGARATSAPVPDGSTPDGSTPDGSTPDGSTPDGSTPDRSTQGRPPEGGTR